MRSSIMLLSAASILFSISAAAESTKYMGISIGQGYTKSSSISLDNTLASQGITAQSTINVKDTAYKIFVGYQFTQKFSIEGGYANLGQVKAAGTFTAPFPGDTFNDTIKASGWNVDAIGSLSVMNNLEAYARLGLIRAKTTSNIIANTAFGTITFPNQATSTSTHYGAGLQYKLTQNWAMRGEYERYNRIGNPLTTGQGDIQVYSLGARYQF